jgi:hypothetical protein
MPGTRRPSGPPATPLPCPLSPGSAFPVPILKKRRHGVTHGGRPTPKRCFADRSDERNGQRSRRRESFQTGTGSTCAPAPFIFLARHGHGDRGWAMVGLVACLTDAFPPSGNSTATGPAAPSLRRYRGRRELVPGGIRKTHGGLPRWGRVGRSLRRW